MITLIVTGGIATGKSTFCAVLRELWPEVVFYDSDRTVARFTAHTAFDDPTSAADAPARESIEVRTLVFFAS